MIALAWVLCSHPALAAPLTVLSWNVNFGLAGDPEAITVIRGIDADVVFLQETTAAWEAALRSSLGDLYPRMGFLPGEAASGMGVLSRLPFDDLAVVPSPGGWFPSWRVTVHAPDGDVQVLQVHLQPPYADHGGFVVGTFTTDDARLAEIQAFLPSLPTTCPLVVLGDFNASHDDAVRWLEHQGLRELVAPGTKTWRWNLPLGHLSARLDHVFVDDRLTDARAEVIQTGRSDHWPVRVTVR